jgi:hypothetical protein
LFLCFPSLSELKNKRAFKVIGEGGFSKSISTFSSVSDLTDYSSLSFPTGDKSILTYFSPAGDYG